MIKINRPRIIENGEKAILQTSIYIPECAAIKYKEITSTIKNCPWRTKEDYPPCVWQSGYSELRFEVDIKYSSFLCTERSDSFVVSMLWYAIITEEDIEFEAEMSKLLYEGLTQKLIPAICKDEYRKIKLIGPITSKKIDNFGAIGLGMTCGADSFYSLLTHDVSHLAYYESGHIFNLNGVVNNNISVVDYYKKAYEIADEKATNAKEVAIQNNKEFVYVKSNLDEDFYRGGIIYRSMYCNLACTLALQKLFKTYISSSSGNSKDVEVGLLIPTQNYENLICDSCKTETMSYDSSDFERRLDKIKYISNSSITNKYLDVCYNFTGHNCGKCYGCIKTMVELDILGKLDDYSQVFDLKDYYANRKERVRVLAEGSIKKEMSSVKEAWIDIVEYARTHNSKISKIVLEENEGLYG